MNAFRLLPAERALADALAPDPTNKLEGLRRAGGIVRFHGRPGLSQRVDQHSWGVAVLIDYLWPGSSAALFRAAIYHDVGELRTGDIPAPVKWALDAPSRETLQAMEDEYRASIVPGGERALTAEEDNMLDIADTLEGMCFCLEQALAGVQMAHPPFWGWAGKLERLGVEGAAGALAERLCRAMREIPTTPLGAVF